MNSPSYINNIQTVFLGQIRDKLPDHVSFADELAELLNVSRDSAYRRIRGETVLSLDEVKKLYDQYGLSIDGIMSPDSNMVLIQHQAVDFNYSLREWLRSLMDKLQLAKSSKQLKLIFAAKDIPVFHYFRFPELAAFKLFVWSKSVIKDPQYEQLLYTPDVLPKEILAEAAKAWQLYSSIPSTEIWSDEIINGTLKQIEFYHECEYFAQHNLTHQLYESLLELIKEIRREATDGKKSEGGELHLYQNEILIPDNTIFANIHNQRMVFINYNTMDLLTTHQESFCEKTEVYMNNLIKNSALISATAEKERNRFFNKIEEKIAVSRSRVN
jgi:plasmid maintenance system antidote protein VapI